MIDERLNGRKGVLTKARDAFDFFNPDTLLVDISANSTIASSGTVITQNETFNIAGTTNANSTIDIDQDGDGEFDDGSTTADSNGNFSLDVTLQHNDTNRGANAIVVRSTDATGETQTETVNVHLAIGSVARFASSEGNIDIELLDDDAPRTVANFRQYYSQFGNSIVHRSARTQTGGDFIIQGGAYVLDGTELNTIPDNGTVDNEFNSANSNVRGTIATAFPAQMPDGATSQWFINVGNNSADLDPQFHTVFGRVIGDGMEVADRIHALSTFDLSTTFPGLQVQELPLKSFETGNDLATEDFVTFSSIRELRLDTT